MFCSVFERGMKCFDSYSARCLQNRKLNLFKNNVEGARKFFNKFCSDEDFQRGKNGFKTFLYAWVVNIIRLIIVILSLDFHLIIYCFFLFFLYINTLNFILLHIKLSVEHILDTRENKYFALLTKYFI